MVKLLRESPLLLFFLVAAVGVLLGRVKVQGFSLGVAAVLFAGLAVGALDPQLALPELVYLFGLVLFVYTVGLSSGPGFFASFRRRGLRDNGFAFAVILAAAALTGVAALILHLRGPLAAGLFAGALTNTPALASVLESLKATVPEAMREKLLAEPVVAYSVAYPMGVIGVIAAIHLMQRVWKIDYAHERLSTRDAAAVARSLESTTVRITRSGLTRDSALALVREKGGTVLFGRMKRGDVFSIVRGDTTFLPGDLVTVVGSGVDVHTAAQVLGEESADHIELDRHVLDFRRIFVSKGEVTEKPLSELRLPERFSAVLTRVRRGDIELLPTGDTVLELGDRVRVVAPRERMGQIADFFGDSYRALSEIDVLTFGVGIALGLLLGSIPVPMGGGASFKLGFAGGPLIVGLLLGRIGRTGRLVWTMSYSANLTLRQLGLVLFLAGVGTRSGYSFVSTLSHGGGLAIFGVGAVITCLVALASLWIGHKVLRIPMGVLVGMLAGIHTQPAALAFATEQTKSDLPNVGYATVYPIATIAKIVLAQVLVLLLRS
jgi:putative transport protein